MRSAIWFSENPGSFKRMKRRKYIFLLLLFMIVAATELSAQKSGAVKVLPSDPAATTKTISLYCHLKALSGKKILFGHQDDLAYGVNWKYEEGRSDIKDVTGEYPAIFGWELGRIEIDAPVNLDSVPFDKMQQYIKWAYKRGCVITISWHLNNPLTGQSAWDPAEGTVRSILPGGIKNEVYKSWLDKVAVFMQSLKGEDGEYIPVIFRPFHELNGSWFWWGKNHCSPEEFKKLWQFTVGYLRDEKKLHHLLIAYNTDKFSSKEDYLERYPGDEWVDIMGFDIYQRSMSKEEYSRQFDRMLTDLETIAKERNKIPALTEFGGVNEDPAWWTGTFLPVLKKHKVVYVLGWRNAGRKNNGEFEYYVPYKGQGSANDFIKFYHDGKILFSDAMIKEKIYE